MKKIRLVSLVLALVFAVACVGGIAADIGIQSVAGVSGNLNTSTGAFYGNVSSALSEYLTVTARLEKQQGSGWGSAGYASNAGTGYSVTASGSTALSSGYYRLTVTGTCPHSGNTVTYYYTIP